MNITEFDGALTLTNEHLKEHSFFLPYVGKNYFENKNRVIIVGESHYLSQELNNKITCEQWYNYDYQITDEIKNKYLNTRNVLNWYPNQKTLKAYRIFYNLENTYRTVFNDVNLFKECVYLNYFQRPAESTGDSIRVNLMDREVAYDNFKCVIQLLEPNKVIFVSKLAYKNFCKSNQGVLDSGLLA